MRLPDGQDQSDRDLWGGWLHGVRGERVSWPAFEADGPQEQGAGPSREATLRQASPVTGLGMNTMTINPELVPLAALAAYYVVYQIAMIFTPRKRK